MCRYGYEGMKAATFLMNVLSAKLEGEKELNTSFAPVSYSKLSNSAVTSVTFILLVLLSSESQNPEWVFLPGYRDFHW